MRKNTIQTTKYSHYIELNDKQVTCIMLLPCFTQRLEMGYRDEPFVNHRPESEQQYKDAITEMLDLFLRTNLLVK